MSTIISYDTFEGLSRSEALSRIGFPVKREHMIGKESFSTIPRDAVYGWNVIEAKDSLLGLIPVNKKILPYKDVSTCIMDKLDSKNIPFKIVSSAIENSKMNMYQKLIFSTEIENPDGEHLSPLMIIRGSYVGKPVSIDFGTYRFICSNGAVVSEDFVPPMKLKSYSMEDLSKMDIAGMVSKRLEKIQRVSERYKELAEEEWISYLGLFMNNTAFNSKMKLHLFEKYKKQGIIDYAKLKTKDFEHLRLAGHTIYDKEGEPVINFNMTRYKERSAWDFYNDLTALSTHELSSESMRNSSYKLISDMFAA